MKRTANNASRNLIANRVEFQGSNLRGSWDLWPSRGVLPSHYVDILREDADNSDGDGLYVIYSYSTPIAWWTESRGWTVPPVKYSRTTTRHQSYLTRSNNA